MYRALRVLAVVLALVVLLPACRKAPDALPARQDRETAKVEDSPPTSRRRGSRKAEATQELRAQVFGVSDGDTVTVRGVGGGEQFRVRLRGIDAPEKAQVFGQRSKEALSDLVFGRLVHLVVYERDLYGRAVADIWVERDGAEVLANLEMIRQGLAWHYARYDRREEFAAAEEEARSARRGLWADASPQPPWQWHRGMH